MNEGSHYPGDSCHWPGNWHGKHGEGAMRIHRENKRRAAGITNGAPLGVEADKPKKRRRRKRNRGVKKGTSNK